jgi:hypothetical protein
MVHDIGVESLEFSLEPLGHLGIYPVDEYSVEAGPIQ